MDIGSKIKLAVESDLVTAMTQGHALHVQNSVHLIRRRSSTIASCTHVQITLDHGQALHCSL
jgi:hypothetical protein